MTVDSAELFFSLLAVVAAVIAVVVGLPWVVRSWRGPVWSGMTPLRVPFAAAITGTCMIGSLYFSEVANFTPCTLCWYQRILMYPSALLLTIAAVRRDDAVRRYVLPLTVLGMGVSTYHILVERYPDVFENKKVCELGVSCAQVWFERLGFVTLPVMALCGFAAATALLAIPSSRQLEDPA